MQNYPNPFNPSTTIKFAIPSSSKYNLKVYDAEEVRTLVDENWVRGSYNITFNASDPTSGVYFYKLQVGNMVQTKNLCW